MKRFLLIFPIAGLFISLFVPPAALADSSHARIVRLSLIQGDVSFVREFHENSIADPNAVWEVGQLNLPIRQGNAISTGNGRAEIEFENGAMAFLDANAVVEFYDLSLYDGARITRLVLRQGSASFYERSQGLDYFSVTGGDFSVAVDGHATFRLENFDDGSSLSVLNGHVQVLQNDKSTPLEKGQSFAAHAQDPGNPVVARIAPTDDFDRWVSSRIQKEEVAISQPQNYGNSSGYVAGYADLYTYGSWFSAGGFTGWRPFGVGLGWSPFDYGSWYFDQGGLGWSFLGTSPWGWLPYHYGGWIFSPAYGWMWNPGGLLSGRPQPYRPATAVFVHSGNTLAIVPMHPGDKPGKTALNLNQGVYPIQGGVIGKSIVATNGEKWSVQKSPQGAGLTSTFAPAIAPTRVVRSITASNFGGKEMSLGRTSSIVYDGKEHRFVNSNVLASAKSGQATGLPSALKASGGGGTRPTGAQVGIPPGARTSAQASSMRSAVLPPRPFVTPAPVHPVGGSSAPIWAGGSRASSAAMPSSSGVSSSPASHPSTTGGARPH